MRGTTPGPIITFAALQAGFARRVRAEGGHAIWTGSLHDKKTPVWMLNGVMLQVNRLAWFLSDRLRSDAGLKGLSLIRRCEDTRCVLPEHHRTEPSQRAYDVQLMIDRALAGGKRDGVKLNTYRVERDARNERPAPDTPAAARTLAQSIADIMKQRERVVAAAMAEPFTPPAPSLIQIVGPYKSGGITVFTPWGTFMGELTMRPEERR